MRLQLTRPICFLDVESTGVDPCADRIIELGFTVFNPGGWRQRWEQRFNPGMSIPAEATAVHGISDADVKDCPTFADQAAMIWSSLQGKDLGGYNLWRLDLPMLDEEFRRCGMKLDLAEIHVIDCLGIFQKKDPRKLEDAVRKYCYRQHEGAHGALADAEATADVLDGQLLAHPELGGMSVEDLATFSRMNEKQLADIAGKLYRDSDGYLRYAFGKHKDKRVVDEKGYANWMLTKARFPGSTCEALESEIRRRP